MSFWLTCTPTANFEHNEFWYGKLWRILIERYIFSIFPVLIATINKFCETKRNETKWIGYFLVLYPWCTCIPFGIDATVARIFLSVCCTILCHVMVYVLRSQNISSKKHLKQTAWINVNDNWPETGNVYTTYTHIQLGWLFWQILWSGYLLFVLVMDVSTVCLYMCVYLVSGKPTCIIYVGLEVCVCVSWYLCAASRIWFVIFFHSVDLFHARVR